ncbi:hypothetical protein [Nitratireductor sp. ZSWI3]|uniref:hypothetical protein n=1 Tax=Nitratireductor sp. ZSWI3 TaxID=2966359 RepID=UPI00214FCB01|nr:hypothetical protein [Nitratireductor sp. ZSWI3]MCR4265550.1 hypothetical protein [Nitratireductor sp. ZSWI3]
MLDPFPGVSRLGDVERLSAWLAEEESIGTFELCCLLAQIERSCKLLEEGRAQIPIRLLYARRVVKLALKRRLEL